MSKRIEVEVEHVADAKSVKLTSAAQIGATANTWASSAISIYDRNWDEVRPGVDARNKFNDSSNLWVQPRCTEIESGSPTTEKFKCLLVVPTYSTMLLTVSTDKYDALNNFAVAWTGCGVTSGATCLFENIAADHTAVSVKVTRAAWPAPPAMTSR